VNHATGRSPQPVGTLQIVRSPIATVARLAVAGIVVATSLAVPATAFAAGNGDTGDLDLPPHERDDIAEIFDPALKKLGLRMTRASLQDLESYRSSPTGTHLATYVEPINPDGVDDDFYLERIVETARVFLPRVFKEWSDLEGFDVCLEPVDIPTPVPPPVSQVQVDRKTAKTIKWRRADLADLMKEAADRSEGGDQSGDRDSFFLYISPRLRDAPSFEAARQDAGLPPLTTTTRATT